MCMRACAGMYVYFFFQAEDGIRDYKVTGVQTCALPISAASIPCARNQPTGDHAAHAGRTAARRHASMTNPVTLMTRSRDRKSTRLNSSHLVISYAVFCLKKKKKKKSKPTATAHVKE